MAAVLILPAIIAGGVATRIVYFAVQGSIVEHRDGKTLFPGVEYSKRSVEFKGEEFVVHISKIDLDMVSLSVSEPVLVAQKYQHAAVTTTDALELYGANLAINASFFTPFRDNHFLDYFPRRGDLVIPVGSTKATGLVYGIAQNDWPVFGISNDRTVAIYPTYTELEASQFSARYLVSGKSRLLADGKATLYPTENQYPRTAIGLDAEGTTLWMVVVDGKQPFYSRGVTLNTLAQYLASIGVHNALELDGGGSATMAWMEPDTKDAQLLSRPIHTKLPRRERPVANHIMVTSSKH